MSVGGWPLLLLIIAHGSSLQAQDADSENMRQLLQSMMLEDALSANENSLGESRECCSALIGLSLKSCSLIRLFESCAKQDGCLLPCVRISCM